LGIGTLTLDVLGKGDLRVQVAGDTISYVLDLDRRTGAYSS
jgi:hypothetical protein